jgi:hypothetical protein
LPPWRSCVTVSSNRVAQISAPAMRIEPCTRRIGEPSSAEGMRAPLKPRPAMVRVELISAVSSMPPTVAPMADPIAVPTGPNTPPRDAPATCRRIVAMSCLAFQPARGIR